MNFLGTTEGVAVIEHIMEHISNVVQKDPLQVRLNNMTEANNPAKQMINDLKTSCDYDRRAAAIEQFNKVMNSFMK